LIEARPFVACLSDLDCSLAVLHTAFRCGDMPQRAPNRARKTNFNEMRNVCLPKALGLHSITGFRHVQLAARLGEDYTTSSASERASDFRNWH
jgi:hypothetical protein